MNHISINSEEFNPKVVFYYRSKSLPPSPQEAHTHDFLTMHYVVSGKVTYQLNGQLFTAHKYDIIIFNPGVLHNHLIEDPETDPESTVFYLGIDDLYIKGYPKDFIPICSAVFSVRKYQQEIYNCYHEIILTQEKKDIGCHKDRIGKQTGIDVVFMLCGFILKLGHAAELAHVGIAV